MDVKEFERLQQKVEDAKREHAQATGALNSLREKWKSTYGFEDPESAKQKLQELRSKHKENEDAILDTSSRLEKMITWEQV